jgi:hypothetical protein
MWWFRAIFLLQAKKSEKFHQKNVKFREDMKENLPRNLIELKKFPVSAPPTTPPSLSRKLSFSFHVFLPRL